MIIKYDDEIQILDEEGREQERRIGGGGEGEEDEEGWFDEFTCRSTLLVISAFTQQFVLLGNLYSWGVFQSEFQSELGLSPAKVSLVCLFFSFLSPFIFLLYLKIIMKNKMIIINSQIGGIAAGTLPTGGLIVGALCDRFGRRPMLLLGMVLIATGLFIASFTDGNICS